ncbi:MAG: pitrilysin family protein [Thermodesulfovibrionia bacterium]|nr:pitrilysin family protein [Thermodesulfovibrionia bacterium]
MKKILITITLLFFSFHSAAAELRDENTARVHEEVLQNGLKVFAIKDTNAPLAVFQIWYDAGSINEQVGKTGLSHLLEHMMFKGTPKYGAKVFSKIIQRAGGVDNAGTSKDFVYYYQKLAPDRLHLSIELEADRMRNLIMETDEFLSERDVVMEERRMRYDDDPQNLVYEEVLSAAFKNHPYRWPVIGWMEDLKTVTRDDLWAYYRTRYSPNNAFIVVAGNIDVVSIMEKIRKEFGDIPRGPDIPAMNITEPEQRGERRVYVKKEAELPYVMSAYKTPNILNDDSYALDVLAGVLSGGKSARIYKSLIDEQRIALSAGAGYSNLDKFPFLFYLYGTSLPGKKIENVENALYAEVEKIKETPPTELEIMKAKNQIESDFIMNQDSIFYQAMILAEFEMLGDWRLKDRYIEGIRKVSPEDVQRVAKKYIVEDQRTVGILIPVKREVKNEN